jgi:3-hydroxyacyl-CoA dehydrogenase
MTQETINAVLGQPVGLPPTGLYGLIDLIGLDVMDLVGKNLAVNLPPGDAGHAFTSFPPAEQRMLERGQLGRKSRELGGFGRVQKLEDGSKRVETFDLVTEEWRDTVEPDLSGVPAELGAVLFADTPQGHVAWQIFGGTLRYAAGLVPEIADDIVNVDNAIRWGFNWVHGPFEMLDAIGPQRVIDKIRAEGADLPAMLQVLHDSGCDTFYRDGSYLCVDGTFRPVPD